MKKHFILLLLAISFLGCKKDKQPKPEVLPQVETLIQGKWTFKNVHSDYVNAAGVIVVSADDNPTSDNIYQFNANTVIYYNGTTTYNIITDGSKKIITINLLAPITAEIKTLTQSTMVLYRETPTNDPSSTVYHDGVYIPYTKVVDRFTYSRL